MVSDAASIGDRMQVARIFLGKTRVDISGELGVNHSTYADYESGRRSTDGKLAAIAEALCVNEAFLTRGPIGIITAHDLSWRKRVSLKSSGAKHVQGCASIVPELRSLMGEFVSLPPVTVPFVPLEDDGSIENAVTSIRNQLTMTDAPLRSALDLVEFFGIAVFWVDGDDQFDGVSFWHNDRPYILLNSRQRDGYRMRFTILHEFAHLVCHRRSGIADRHEEERRILDREADRFASAFLLPASSFARRFPRYGTLFDILEERRYWQTSCSAMVRRAKDLNLIDENRYRQLCVGISAKGWRKGEPGSPAPESSKTHRFFLDQAGDMGATSRMLSEELQLRYEVFRECIPLSDEYQERHRIEIHD